MESICSIFRAEKRLCAQDPFELATATFVSQKLTKTEGPLEFTRPTELHGTEQPSASVAWQSPAQCGSILEFVIGRGFEWPKVVKGHKD